MGVMMYFACDQAEIFCLRASDGSHDMLCLRLGQDFLPWDVTTGQIRITTHLRIYKIMQAIFDISNI